MTYQDEFTQFWKEVESSANENRFAKLTMAKTIGKLDLRNIFVRPVFSEKGFRVLLKFRYRSRETQDKEDELTLEETHDVIKKHLRAPFSSVLLFTTSKDITFKINKKGIPSITEGSPTFKDVTFAEPDSEE